MIDALVIGAGPAGLMAAEELALAGAKVLICEGKPSPARKLLMAGKSGLNITKDQPRDDFIAAYDSALLAPILAGFGPREMVIWSRALGIEVFTGTSGRVFPRDMKASPLLRAWLARLGAAGVELRTRWRWTGFDGTGGYTFDTALGAQVLRPRVCVLALGGASWARLGSDGAWTGILADKGVCLAPWQPANMGFGVEWSAHMARHFGQAIKGAALSAGAHTERGEFVISQRGLEGGGIYAVSRALRMGAALHIDLMPDTPHAAITAKLSAMKRGETRANRLRKLGLAPQAVALIQEFARDSAIEDAIKHLSPRLTGPRPLDEAISVAGGITTASLTPDMELRAIPNLFACGEMLDWEAPTGGYLLTAAWATGQWAGRAAARRLATGQGQSPAPDGDQSFF
jgi:uncharacterized flavoprotein (TIGR03862 family)